MMKVDDFDFELPPSLIAQSPLQNRSSSRLMCLDRQTGQMEHDTFEHIVERLLPGDTLVLNDTRVIPARLFGHKIQTGAHVELLLLKQTEDDHWETLVKPAKKVQIGTQLEFGGLLRATCTDHTEAGGRIFRFEYSGVFMEIVDQLGHMPLPPYIKETLVDSSRYQTVYAKHAGSAAAPTAGLHFTDELLSRLANKGVRIAYITLHVGLGTFRPVQVEDILEHHMHSEYYEVNEHTAEMLNDTIQSQGRIIAGGTTTIRTLETIMQQQDLFTSSSGWTDIFIYPGYDFKAIQGMITNFHLPKSTLLMLVSAFAGRDHVLQAYHEAIAQRYRFFSFGDAMLII